MSLTEALTLISCSSLFLLLPFFVCADNIFTHAVSAAARVLNDQSLGEERGASHVRPSSARVRLVTDQVR